MYMYTISVLLVLHVHKGFLALGRPCAQHYVTTAIIIIFFQDEKAAAVIERKVVNIYMHTHVG